MLRPVPHHPHLLRDVPVHRMVLVGGPSLPKAPVMKDTPPHHRTNYPPVRGGHYQVGLDVVVLQVVVPVAPVARFHLVVGPQTLEGLLGDVHPSGEAAALHVVGEGDVVGPHVELPLSQTQHAAVHPPRVDAHPHVHVHLFERGSELI